MPTNDYSKNIIYLSKEQYQQLITNRTLTANGQTITYNDNDIYVTPQEEPYIKPSSGIPASDLASGVIPSVPVQDVQIDGTSILNQGVANIPVSGASNYGVVKVRAQNGFYMGSQGHITPYKATDEELKAGTQAYHAILPVNQHTAVFYGLAKASGDSTQASSSNPVGTYTDTAKQKIQNMLGITDILSTEESSTATAAHAINSTFMIDGKLHRATVAIAVGDAVVVGTNCEVVKADEVFVKNTEYATSDSYGLVKIGNGLTININTGKLQINSASTGTIKSGGDGTAPIVPSHQHEATFYGLSKVAGVDLKNETVTLGTYPETSKTAIRTLIGAGTPLDIQVNSTSIINNGIANIPIASDNTLGLVKGPMDSQYGIIMGYNGNSSGLTPTGVLMIRAATATDIRVAESQYYPITPKRAYQAVFYGLARAAGDTTQAVSSTGGIYTDEAKGAIQNMLGITSLFANEEHSTATAAHSINSLFMMNGKLLKTTSAIAIGDAVTVGTNCTQTTIDEAFLKVTDANETYATILNPIFTNSINMGRKANTTVGPYSVAMGQNVTAFGNFAYAVGGNTVASNTGAFAEGAGTTASGHCAHASGFHTIASGDNSTALGYYTISPLSNGYVCGQFNAQVQPYDAWVANQSYIIGDKVTIQFGSGMNIKYCGYECIEANNDAEFDYSKWKYLPSNGDNYFVIGNGIAYNDRSNALAIDYKGNGYFNGNIYVGCNTDSTGGTRIPHDVQIGGVSIVSNGVATIPVRNNIVNNSNELVTSSAVNTALNILFQTNSHIQSGTQTFRAISPSNQHTAVFYGLAKAAGDTTMASSSNAVGTYTTEAKSAIQIMLGVPGDVQVNGTSIVSNGVANIPLGGADVLGVGRYMNGFGVTINSDPQSAQYGRVYIYPAVDADFKDMTRTGAMYRPIVPTNIHKGVFYGLAKAAGDTTQAASSNAVGTYTAEAKAAIHTMLGIDPASIAAQVDIPLVETVSGTTPTITGQPNVRYVCGEVSTISITPPASGSVDVIFESGSTATVMTVPSTVKWPTWFDATSLEANTTYEILITDGTYGSVMTWAT